MTTSTATATDSPQRTQRTQRTATPLLVFSSALSAFSASSAVKLLLLLLSVPSLSPAQRRDPPLEQVKVPHSYYWREMYVPQVTSGPSALTWSPNGREVIYSMQGSLWRQLVGSDEADQLTAGDTYDFQPDWSPDGRSVVYTVYNGRSLALMLLDLPTGEHRVLLDNGAVNVEPRWSPDGSRIAFVSTADHGRWHVFVARFANARLDSAVRVTEDRDGGQPRYYYSRYDHYLSPSWSPDGKELIFVSNRGRIYGTGGLWRMDAAPGSTPREIHFEETTWKARPDWNRDGRRVVYSSYHGRQWNQLWLAPSERGDPIQLTYGEYDATAPRWSPDGSRIGYISNEGGNTSLWTVTIPGGKRERVNPRTRRYLKPMGRLIVGRARLGDAPADRGAHLGASLGRKVFHSRQRLAALGRNHRSRRADVRVRLLALGRQGHPDAAGRQLYGAGVARPRVANAVARRDGARGRQHDEPSAAGAHCQSPRSRLVGR